MEVHNVSSTFNKDWYSDKAKIIKQDENFMIIDYGCQEKGIVTSYTLFDGIQLSFLDFDTDISMPSQKFNPNIISITHCRSGRYECEYANHTVSYLPEGYFSVTGTQHLPVSFSFPLKKYYGLSLVIDKQSLSEEIKKMMETIPLNLDKIGSTLGIENNGYLSSTPPKLHHLFSELYEALNIEQLGYFKIKAIELLYHIDQLTKNHGCDFKYYDKRQIQATKEIQTYMITHLDERVSLEQLAFRNQINLSLFHKIFLQIYGDTPYSYLKKYKMNIAAHWLLNENMKIGDIAVSLGYNNASKFAIAFQSVYGILPKDYRKQK